MSSAIKHPLLLRLVQNKQLCLGGSLLLLFILAASAACFIPSELLQRINLNNKFAAVSWQHWLGTDHLGRDIFLQLIKGAQNSLLIAGGAILIALSFGVMLGAGCLFAPPWLRAMLYYGNTLIQSFPAILIAIILVTIIGPGAITICLAIGIACIPLFARLTLTCGTSLMQRSFVLTARTLGKSNCQIFYQHLLPNMAAILLVQASVECVIAILAEAALSYLGLGIQPPAVSWGRMLSEAQNWLFQAPQLAIYPGLAIALIALSIQWLADGMRDYFDIHQL